MKSLYLWIWNFLGVGGTKWKNHGNSRGWGSSVKPSEMENPRGWGVKLEKTLSGWGGYGYFLEPHIPSPERSQETDSKGVKIS